MKSTAHIPVESTRSRQLVAAIVFGGALLLAVAAAPEADDKAAPAKDMRQFYPENCAGCHGVDGSARDAAGKSLSGQDLTDAKWLKDTQDKSMVKVILKGLWFGYAMPAFKDKLTEAEAQAMVTDVIRKAEKGKPIAPPARAATPAPAS